MDAAVEGLGHLGVDLAAKAGQAAERRLDMAAGAAEPVVEVEVPERGVEIVAPHQADHAAAEPDAFGVSGRAVDGLGRLDEFVGLALVVLATSAGLAAGGLPGLILGRGCRSGRTRRRSDQEGQAGSGESGAKPQLLDQAPVDAYIPRLVSGRAAGL